MKNLKKYLALAIVVSFLASCSVSGPLYVTNNTITKKRGVAHRTIFLGFTFGNTDLGVITAAKNGGISKVATVDWKITSGFFRTTYETVVTGE